MRSLFYSVAFLLAVTANAHADTVQLVSSSQLSAADSQVKYPGFGEAYGPMTFAAGGNNVTFENAGNGIQFYTAGNQYVDTGFANGTNVLYSAGFGGPTGPIEIIFSDPVYEFGLNAEEFVVGDENFQFAVFNDSGLLGLYTVNGNDPKALAFIGARSTNGIKYVELSDRQGEDIGIGPVSSRTLTPEPSSFALLGTGLLGLIGVARRRSS